MPGTRPTDILRRVDPTGAADRALAARYASHNDEAAFAEIVRRHGPVVWAACLRVAGHRQDAEDAFQAAFLLFSRRLSTLRNPDLLGNYLYGVAVRVSLKARRAAARRRKREVQVPTMPDPPDLRGLKPPGSPDGGDLGPVIDEELAALPGHYRDAVVLCDLRGASRAEAAMLLGVPEGTVSSRLANGRKKLAARLAARGVTLSAAAVPGVMSAGARAAVPAGLAARVVQVATGSVAPAAVVARLASGGTIVERLFLFGVACAAAAGVVYAAGTADPPRIEPPRPVAKADPPPKPDAKAAPDDQGAFTTTPRIARVANVALSGVYGVAWSPDGKALAVHGTAHPLKKDEKPRWAVYVYPDVLGPAPAPGEEDTTLRADPGSDRELVGFTPDNRLLTDLRERELITGIHRLDVWGPKKPPAGKFANTFGDPSRGQLAVERAVELDATDTHGYHFAADDKTFRTVAYQRDGTAAPTKIDVREVDAATGKTLRSVLKAEYVRPFVLSRDGRRLAAADKGGKVTVLDVDRGAKLSEYQLPEPPPAPKGKGDFGGREPDEPRTALAFSPDGRRLVVTRGPAPSVVVVLDADTGKALPPLDGLDLASTAAGQNPFSGDGRLVALAGSRYEAKKSVGPGGREQTALTPRGDFLTVWEVGTGRVLKSWARLGSATVAFHPTRPVLAILEPHGDVTRLGLWDFAADVPKK